MNTEPLTVTDLIRAGRFDDAVDRMQELCRIQDPEVPVDAEQVRKQYESTRDRLEHVVPPAPFKIVIKLVKT